jgi:glycosyltransferase involved in cell wall biosynthesis
MKTLVIMPTYNEIESLPVTLAGVLHFAPDVDILIVDDGSPDGTGELAETFAAQSKRIHVLHRTVKDGLGGAYLAGFKWAFKAGYESVVEMDADGSHRPEDLPKLLNRAGQAELVIGSRWVPGGAVENWPWYRKMISKGGTLYASIMLRSNIKDITAGFRVYNAKFLSELDLAGVAARGYGFQVEMAWRTQRAGGRVIEVPIVFVERTQGASKMTTAIVLEALWLVTKWGLFKR